MSKKISPAIIASNKISKPLEDVVWLSKLAIEGRNGIVYTTGSAVSINPQTIYFLINGIIRLYREEGDFLLHMIESPSILGITGMFYPTKLKLYLHCETDCEFILMNTDEFYFMVEQTNSWKNISNILANYLITSLESNQRVLQKGAYPIIRRLILEYSNLSEQARERMPLYAYIVKRSGLSRSGVMDIISVLNRRGYIRTCKGYLLDIVEIPTQL
ncbi:helix-turn-helix domain-containing protein [Salmonella enterica]